jgi:uncharacterized protein YdhG (YjbR/CyaY superfamily)
MSQPTYTSVDQYLAAQSETGRKALLQIKACILKVEPQAEELINYNIPAYALKAGGKRDAQIMMAAFKNHVGLYPHPTTIERFAKALSPYKHAKGSVQFPHNQALPLDLIEQMVAYRKSLL